MYSEYVSVPLVIQHSMRIRSYFIVFCGLSDSTEFFQFI
jgi:hypothetical protein